MPPSYYKFVNISCKYFAAFYVKSYKRTWSVIYSLRVAPHKTLEYLALGRRYPSAHFAYAYATYAYLFLGFARQMFNAQGRGVGFHFGKRRCPLTLQRTERQYRSNILIYFKRFIKAKCGINISFLKILNSRLFARFTNKTSKYARIIQ